MAGRNKSLVRGPQLRKLVESKVVYVVICVVVYEMRRICTSRDTTPAIRCCSIWMVPVVLVPDVDQNEV
jgi:hypothetical protein